MAKKIEFPTRYNFESVQNQAVLNSLEDSRLTSHTYLFGCWLLQDCVYLQSTSWQWPCKILWALGMTPGLLFGKGLGGTHQVQLCHWGLASKIFLKICCRSWRTVRLDLGMSTQLQGQPNLKTDDVKTKSVKPIDSKLSFELTYPPVLVWTQENCLGLACLMACDMMCIDIHFTVL